VVETTRELANVKVLVVEDEPLIAMSLADQLTKAGAVVVGPCSTIGRAVAELSKRDIDVAIVDYVLADNNSEGLQAVLEERSVPFVVVTGYPRVLVRRNTRQRVLSKPISTEALTSAIRSLARA
jgi:DNA-binding response OmpR family regulator